MNRNRRAFTLTELLIVVGILLLLSLVSLAIVRGGRSEENMRLGARVAQSAFLGAKDRAVHAKEMRGIRATFDPQNANLITGFYYVAPVVHELYPARSIRLERLDAIDNTTGKPPADGLADSQDVVIVRGVGGQTDWFASSSRFASPLQIRIPARTGRWYQFDTSPLSATSEALLLVTPYAYDIQRQAPSVIACDVDFDTTNSCEIQFGNDLLPFQEPMPLPAGVVIDLRYCSPGVRLLVSQWIDVMFAPAGHITGTAGGLGLLAFTLRDQSDAIAGLDPSNPNCHGSCLVVSLNPSTGLVQTYPADLADANGDGIADNLFSFVQAGKAAGR